MPSLDSAAMTTSTTCSQCGAAVSGRFCAECGTPVATAACGTCSTTLTPGAKFCHRCGTPVGGGASAAPAPRGKTILPWSIAAISATVAITLAVQASATPDLAAGAPAGDGPPPGMVAPFAGGAGGGGGAPPDISQMSPEERADRLYNRIMGYAERGKTDSAAFFAPMALMAYQALGTPSLDQRYHVGTIGLATGDADGLGLARAEADTILKENPKHLLGLILAAQAAERRQDAKAKQQYEQRFLAALSSETGAKREEYEMHKPTIDAVTESLKKK